MPDWAVASLFAEAAAITPQAARLALRRAFAGYLWRGHALEVRSIFGRGGRSGLSYQVSLRSLSEALEASVTSQIAYHPTPSDQRRFTAATDQDAIIGERFSIIEKAVAWTPRSPERIAAIKAASERRPERTIRNWIAAYEAHGMAGLANERPSNAGKARVFVSREFDTAFLAAGYSPDLLAQIGEAAASFVRRTWTSRAEETGWRGVGRLAEHQILEECERLGVNLPTAAFRLSRRSIERFRHFRIVNQRKNDRKAYDDARPATRRSWAHFAPMDMVVADVKPIDIQVRRADGTIGWPRIIGFFDPGTGRLFAYPVLCKKGEGVRQEHVNDAFIAMAMDLQWGFPRQIYTDNGGELKGLEKIRSALERVSGAKGRGIIYALPYQARSKPVEGAFARLDKQVTPLFPGYSGKDRMVKKTQTVGKPPAAYPHDWERYSAELLTMIGEMNHTPYLSGWRRGRSGMDILAAHVEQGWRSITIDPLELDAAFCKVEERKVSKFGVSINGVHYVHAELHQFTSRKVRVALPWRRSGTPLFNGDKGWFRLEPNTPLPADWIEGAKESKRRQQLQDRAVRDMERLAPPIDALDVGLRKAARRQPLAIPASAIPIDTGGQLAALAHGRAQQPSSVAELTETQRARLMQDRQIAALLRQDKANAA